TMCASVCVPTKITALQTSRVNKIINDFELTGNEMNLREFLHRNRKIKDTKALDKGLDVLEEELSKLKAGESYNNVMKVIDNELDKFLIAKADASGFIANKTYEGWVLTSKEPPIKTIKEYQVNEKGYKALTIDNAGIESFFQGHHGVQSDWAEKRLFDELKQNNKYKIKGKSVFDDAELYDHDLAPALNLRDHYAGTPHQRITSRQMSRKSEIGLRTYADEKTLAELDLQIAGVPENIIKKTLDENDVYFQKIRNNIKNKLMKNKDQLNLTESQIDIDLNGIFGMSF
ncbi:MAG: hypothetical protein M3Q56_00560, partial [Bacteroidota bacterium]|nr:hypothetical protein [Bacteroidota bacterium]